MIFATSAALAATALRVGLPTLKAGGSQARRGDSKCGWPGGPARARKQNIRVCVTVTVAGGREDSEPSANSGGIMSNYVVHLESES
jgi:hypothetical protein